MTTNVTISVAATEAMDVQVKGLDSTGTVVYDIVLVPGQSTKQPIGVGRTLVISELEKK
jgi:hypothetical protein